jgi:hypothetical protein
MEGSSGEEKEMLHCNNRDALSTNPHQGESQWVSTYGIQR